MKNLIAFTILNSISPKIYRTKAKIVVRVIPPNQVVQHKKINHTTGKEGKD